jgi:restriction system protein
LLPEEFIFISIILILLCIFIPRFSKSHAENKLKVKPCQHGTSGAFINKNLCSVCIQEAALQKQNEDEKNKRLAEESLKKRTADYHLFLEKIKAPSYLKTMNPMEFEKLCGALYKKMGYEVIVTRYVADNGIDAFIKKDGQLGVLQAKRFKGYVGEPILRDLYGAMHSAGASFAVVVTTGKVSQSALKWVNGKPIQIIELKELVGLLESHFNESDYVPDDFEVGKPGMLICPECNGELIKRKGRRGAFWGCSRFPKCRFTQDYIKQ